MKSELHTRTKSQDTHKLGNPWTRRRDSPSKSVSKQQFARMSQGIGHENVDFRGIFSDSLFASASPQPYVCVFYSQYILMCIYVCVYKYVYARRLLTPMESPSNFISQSSPIHSRFNGQHNGGRSYMIN